MLETKTAQVFLPCCRLQEDGEMDGSEWSKSLALSW